MSDLIFCGRASELQTLREIWARASNLEDPSPQLAILAAERGVGKTRLAVEFYRWLRESSQAGDDGYWPPAIPFVGSSWRVNPDPRQCDFRQPMPFLWWGLRLEEGPGSGAISGHDAVLAPHLVPLLKKAEAMRRGLSLGRVWASVAADAAMSALQIDTLFSIGEGVFETIRIVRESAGEDIGDRAREAAGQVLTSRADAVLADLELVLNPQSLSYARTPTVIFFDDAQFSKEDASFTSFAERLLYTAQKQKWPLMVLVTHWKRDLSLDYTRQENSFAGILHHARHAGERDRGPAAGQPGGYLSAGGATEIVLRTVPDLCPALVGRLPGLTREQQDALLRQSGGNPRHLEQIVEYLLLEDYLFEGCDVSQALTEEGLREALEETHEIFRTVLKRLRAAPDDVQKALGLASLQGVQFSTAVVNDIAQVLFARELDEEMRRGEDPYSFIERGVGAQRAIGAFTEHLFYEVAAHRRRSIPELRSEEDLDSAVEEVLERRLEKPFGHRAEELVTLRLAAAKFAQGGDDRRAKAMRALARQVALEAAAHDYEQALQAASRFVALAERTPGWAEAIGIECAAGITDLLTSYGRVEEAKRPLPVILEKARMSAEGTGDRLAWEDFALWLNRAAEIARVAGDYPTALAKLDESLNIAWLLYDHSATSEALHLLGSTYTHIGAAEAALGEHERAYDARRESLAIARDLYDRFGTLGAVRLLATALEQFGDSARTKGDHLSAGRAYQELLETWRDIVARFGGSDLNMRALAVALQRAVDTASAEGRYGDAAEACEEGLAIARDLAERLGTPQAQRDMAVFLGKKARIATLRGDRAAAARARGEEVSTKRDLAARLGTHEAQSDLAHALQDAGWEALLRGDLSAAHAAYEEAVRLARAVAARLETFNARADLATALNGFGDAARARADEAAAESAYRESLGIKRELAQRSPAPALLASLAVSIERIADLSAARGDDRAADDGYREAVEIVRPLADRPDDVDHARHLSILLNKVGDRARARGGATAAAEAFREGLAIRRRLADRLGTPQALRELSVSVERVGTALEAGGDVAGAAAAYEESLAIRRGLVARDPSFEALRDLSIGLGRKSVIASAQGNEEAALAAERESIEIARGLAARFHSPEAVQLLADALKRAGNAAVRRGDHLGGLDLWDESAAVLRGLAEEGVVVVGGSPKAAASDQGTP